MESKAHVAHGPLIASWVAKAHVFKHEPFPNLRRHLNRVGRRSDRRLHIEKVEEVFEEEALLIDVSCAKQQSLNQIAAARKRHSKTRRRPDEIPPKTGAHKYDDIGAVITCRADY